MPKVEITLALERVSRILRAHAESLECSQVCPYYPHGDIAALVAEFKRDRLRAVQEARPREWDKVFHYAEEE